MGIFNDIKKILWANKAIAKNTANKAADAAKEKGGEFVEFAKEEANDLAGKMKETANDFKDKAEDFVEDVGGKIKMTGEVAIDKAKDFTEDIGAKVLGKERMTSMDTEENDVMDDIMKDRHSSATEGTYTTNTDSMNASMEEKLKQAKEYAGDLSGQALEKGGELYKKLSGQAAEIGEQLEKSPTVKKAGEIAEKVGDKVLDTGEQFMEKFGEVSEKVGEQVLDKGGKAMEKLGDIAEDFGAKVLKAKDDLMAKAEAEAAKSGETFDDAMTTAKDLSEKLKDKISGKVDFEKDFAKSPIDIKESELADKGSFFEKARRFAEGDYHGTGKNEKPEGTLDIKDDPDYVAKKKEGNTKGFEDLDGDGNDLIDDAIIES